MESRKWDFETQGERQEGKIKLVPQIRKAYTRAREEIQIIIDGSSDIGFLCSNMQIEAIRANYDMEFKKLD